MADQENFARTVLARYPEMWETVLGSDEFRGWKERLPSVVVDGTRYYIREGDLLQDEDELALDWARRTGLLTDAAVAAIDREVEARLPPDVETVSIK